MNAKAICEKAASLVSGDREKTHGNKTENHQNIADQWNAYLGNQLTSPITPRQACLMMALLKIARTKCGAFNSDDYVDLAGYAGCSGEIASLEQVVE